MGQYSNDGSNVELTDTCWVHVIGNPQHFQKIVILFQMIPVVNVNPSYFVLTLIWPFNTSQDWDPKNAPQVFENLIFSLEIFGFNTFSKVLETKVTGASFVFFNWFS